MIVKFSDGSITFKITEDEMRQLLADSSLEKKIMIGQKQFGMAVDLNAHRYSDDKRESPLRLIPDPSGFGVLMLATREEIQKLADLGKNREGISVKNGDLEVILQVDVRGDGRPRKN